MFKRGKEKNEKKETKEYLIQRQQPSATARSSSNEFPGNSGCGASAKNNMNGNCICTHSVVFSSKLRSHKLCVSKCERCVHGQTSKRKPHKHTRASISMKQAQRHTHFVVFFAQTVCEQMRAKCAWPNEQTHAA